ncbi:MAG: DUF664 domain-containing protein [Propionibacteriaceae bacterium]|nr:DUF664 domain-containing protein [Propionibacteriaceae bacterium]
MVDGGKSGPVGALCATRQHVLKIVGGLDDTALRRLVLPSGWNWLEMIKHLTCDEELLWFRAVVAGRAWSDRPLANTQRPSVLAGGRHRSPPMCLPAIAPKSNSLTRSSPPLS